MKPASREPVARTRRRSGRPSGATRGPARWSGFVTLPLVGVLLLGMFALAVVLVPAGGPGRVTATLSGERAAADIGRSVSEGAEKAADTDGVQDTDAEAVDEPAAGGPEPAWEPAEAAEPIEATVRFPHNGTRLTLEGIAELRRFTERANEADTARVHIAGYGDSTGSAQENEKITLERAERVESYLRAALTGDGIEFTAVGRGARNPVADNDTEEGRAANRRVEVRAEPAEDVFQHGK